MTGRVGALLATDTIEEDAAAAAAAVSRGEAISYEEASAASHSVLLGAMEWRLALLGAMLLPVVLAGTWLGRKADGHVTDRAWRIFVGLVLAAAAIAALVKLVG